MLYQYISILSLSNSLFIYTCSKSFSVTNMATKIFSVAALPMLKYMIKIERGKESFKGGRLRENSWLAGTVRDEGLWGGGS